MMVGRVLGWAYLGLHQHAPRDYQNDLLLNSSMNHKLILIIIDCFQ